MEKDIIGKLIIAAITFILGAILIGIIATSSLEKTSPKFITQETVAVPMNLTGLHVNTSRYSELAHGCPYATAWRSDQGCSIDIKNVYNATGTLLTENTDYVVVETASCLTGDNTDGDIRFLDTAPINKSVANSSLVTYSYCGDDYLVAGWNRTIINMLAGLFAMALIGAAVAFFLSIYKDLN